MKNKFFTFRNILIWSTSILFFLLIFFLRKDSDDYRLENVQLLEKIDSLKNTEISPLQKPSDNNSDKQHTALKRELKDCQDKIQNKSKEINQLNIKFKSLSDKLIYKGGEVIKGLILPICHGNEDEIIKSYTELGREKNIIIEPYWSNKINLKNIEYTTRDMFCENKTSRDIVIENALKSKKLNIAFVIYSD